MLSMRQTQDMARLFGIAPAHTLKLQNRQRKQRQNTWYETRWFDEHDVNSKLVGRYHTWTHQGTQPPYRRQVGWEKYSLSGTLLDREVRYSKRENNNYVH